MSNQKKLDQLHDSIAACVTCNDHGIQIAKPFSMSRGTADASVMVIGLAPGGSARRSGKAFHGGSFSRLRTWFADAGYALSDEALRSRLYLTSLTKCGATHDSRSSRQAMWSHCQPFLWRQLQLVQPRLVLLLGKEVAETILNRKEALSAIAGTCTTTEEAFVGELFPPLQATSRWLVMPHPSGLSRLMNEDDLRKRVLRSLSDELARIHFWPSGDK